MNINFSKVATHTLIGTVTSAAIAFVGQNALNITTLGGAVFGVIQGVAQQIFYKTIQWAADGRIARNKVALVSEILGSTAAVITSVGASYLGVISAPISVTTAATFTIAIVAVNILFGSNREKLQKSIVGGEEAAAENAKKAIKNSKTCCKNAKAIVVAFWKHLSEFSPSDVVAGLKERVQSGFQNYNGGYRRVQEEV